MTTSTVADTGAPTASVLRPSAVRGAAAGVVGGLVFGAAMASVGTLPTVASIVRTSSPVIGFALHMVFAAVIGAGFGLLVAHQRVRGGETLFWGLLYGAFWWFLGPLTLLPLLRGEPVAWDLPSAQAVLPSLFGHLFYGGATALAYVALHRGHHSTPRPRIATAMRGIGAGVAVSAVLYLGLDVMAGAALGWLFVVGAVAGVGYPALFGADPERAGPALIRGTAYGFLCWIVAGLTLPPLSHGVLDWSPAAVASAVDLLPAYLLLGAGTAAVFTGLGTLGRWLFVDDIRTRPVESPGDRGGRSLRYGALAGVAGGLLFTVVMVLVNELPQVAGLVGAHTPVVGLVVHVAIAVLIGVSYAVLFRRRSFDLASGIGWGVSYGFLWWVLGNLTLLPVLLGGPPQWSAAAIAAGFPSLVGHLAYGGGLGAVYYRLEDHTNPWWFVRSEIETQRVSAQRDQTLGSAPALWGLIVFIAVTIPVLVGA